MRKGPIFIGICLAVTLPAPAFAYIGPGAGLSAIGSVLSFLGVILLLLAGYVWYPVKRLIKKLRGADPALDSLRKAEQSEK